MPSGTAAIEGWTAFGQIAKPFENDPNLYWKLHISVDVREAKVHGIPGQEDLKLNVFGMPFDYEIGRIINLENVGGFFVWGSIGYDPLLWLLKSIASGEIPSSLVRYGFGGGYQTPIPSLQVRLGYKNTDTGFDGRQLTERGYSLGVAYQM